MARLSRKQQQDKRELLSSLNHVNNIRSSRHAAENQAFHCSDVNGQNGIDETDLVFLEGISDNPAVTQTFKVQDNSFQPVEEIVPVQLDIRNLCRNLSQRLSRARNPDARELSRIISKTHFKALIETHDEVGARALVPKPSIDPRDVLSKKFIEATDYPMPGAETIRMVGLRRKPNEPLGLTVEVDEHKQLVVARILAGGMIDRQALLRTGDVILEVNGTPVSSPEQLQDQIMLAKESITLKIGPSVDEEMKSARLLMAGGQVKNARNLDTGKKLTCYMRALFDYEPEEDALLPCKEIGLPFQYGDILQIINVKDPNWWQAKHLGPNEVTGLVPSQELEERRKAFVPPEADFVHSISICGTKISKKKLKKLYKSKENADYDKADLVLYEEVTRMPPFKRKTLVLVGCQGVGRRTLKNRLINSDQTKFGSVIPHTSRPPRVLEENGKNYWFMDREDMERDVRDNKFLENGDYNGNLYGTHLDSVRDIIKQGKMCVLDCAPSALKMLHNSTEFMPYVIFIAAPGMEQLKQLYAERRATGGSQAQRNLAFDRQSSIRYSSRRARTLESLASLYEDDDLITTVEESALLQRKYEKYLDMVIVNEDFDITFRKVIEALDALSHEHQWVPVNWIY